IYQREAASAGRMEASAEVSSAGVERWHTSLGGARPERIPRGRGIRAGVERDVLEQSMVAPHVHVNAAIPRRGEVVHEPVHGTPPSQLAARRHSEHNMVAGD